MGSTFKEFTYLYPVYPFNIQLDELPTWYKVYTSPLVASCRSPPCLHFSASAFVQHQSLSALQVVVLVAKPPVVPMAARLGLGSSCWQRSGMAVDSLRSSLEQKPKNHCPVRIGRRLQVQVPSLLVQELGCCS